MTLARTLTCSLSLCLAALACTSTPSTTPTDELTTTEPAAQSAALAPMLARIDTSADPCQDFYQYACGAWIANTEIPPDRPFTAVAFDIIDETERILRQILEAAAADPGDDPNTKLLGDYYAACMDQATIDAAGITPLEPALAKIAAVKDFQSALELEFALVPWGSGFFVSGGIWPDSKDPGVNQLQLGQGDLGLPSRDFYLGDDEASKQLLAAYRDHLAQMLELAGDAPADAAKWAEQLVALETFMAETSLPLEQLRDADATYNKMSIAELDALTPKLAWREIFAAGGLPQVEQVIISTPAYLTSLAKHMRKVDAGLIRAHMRARLVRDLAPHLSAEIAARAFAFEAMVTGQREQEARWKRCVNDTSEALPELLGPAYVEAAFGGESKAVATEMIVAVEAAFEAGLDALAWMDDETRTRAKAKAAKIVNKVGYPDRWRDYSSVTIDRGDYFGSMLSARKLEAERDLAKAGQRVDPSEWHMPAFMLNAYANPTGMEMVFPAGILQAPIFSLDQHMAINFGSAGSIMGHELTHHFDDQGRKYDQNGELRDWWAPAAETAFEAEAACVAEAYSGYEAQPGLFVNGQQTLGENIADIGGLEAARAAFAVWAEQNPEAAASPDPSLTPEQIFFLAFAQTYCGKASPEMDKMQVLSDVHAPRQFRANGSVANNPAFWAAFACEEGTPMHPADACEVW